jgi:hypothetical protein
VITYGDPFNRLGERAVVSVNVVVAPAERKRRREIPSDKLIKTEN